MVHCVLIVAEAVYMGLPIISTRVGEATTICPAESSVLLEVGDVIGFTSALSTLIWGETVPVSGSTLCMDAKTRRTLSDMRLAAQKTRGFAHSAVCSWQDSVANFDRVLVKIV